MSDAGYQNLGGEGEGSCDIGLKHIPEMRVLASLNTTENNVNQNLTHVYPPQESCRWRWIVIEIAHTSHTELEAPRTYDTKPKLWHT